MDSTSSRGATARSVTSLTWRGQWSELWDPEPEADTVIEGCWIAAEVLKEG